MQKYSPNDLPYNNPEESRKVAIVTGSSSGLGYYTTLHLYLHGWTVYMACRNEQKTLSAIGSIHAEATLRKPSLPSNCVLGELKFLHLDLSQLQHVVDCVEKFKLLEPSLDLLVNNAGVMALPYSETTDGYEIQIQTDHIGPYLLTRLLLPLLKRSAYVPRIIFVSSIGHYLGTRSVDLSKGYNYVPNIVWTWPRYGNAKTANIHTTLILSKLYPEILSIAVHPGFALHTELLSYWRNLPVVGTGFGHGFTLFNKVFGVTPEQGSYSILQASLSERFTLEDRGKYLITYGADGRPSRIASNYGKAINSWQWTEDELIKKGFKL